MLAAARRSGPETGRFRTGLKEEHASDVSPASCHCEDRHEEIRLGMSWWLLASKENVKK